MKAHALLGKDVHTVMATILDSHLWTTEYGPDELLRLEKAIYNIIKETFKNFALAHHNFLRYPVGESA